MSTCINCGQTENAEHVIANLSRQLHQAREEKAELLAALVSIDLEFGVLSRLDIQALLDRIRAVLKPVDYERWEQARIATAAAVAQAEEAPA